MKLCGLTGASETRRAASNLRTYSASITAAGTASVPSMTLELDMM